MGECACVCVCEWGASDSILINIFYHTLGIRVRVHGNDGAGVDHAMR